MIGRAALLLALTLSAAAAEPLAVEIASAEAAFDLRTSVPIVSFRMTPDSARRFSELTANNVGRKMQIRVDGRPLMAPVIREPILGGSGQIADPSFTAEEVRELAARMASGRAKVEFEIVD